MDYGLVVTEAEACLMQDTATVAIGGDKAFLIGVDATVLAYHDAISPGIGVHTFDKSNGLVFEGGLTVSDGSYRLLMVVGDGSGGLIDDVVGSYEGFSLYRT